MLELGRYIQEKNESGQIICSGCKEVLDPLKCYSQRVEEDGKFKFYSVHKRCRVKGGGL